MNTKITTTIFVILSLFFCVFLLVGPYFGLEIQTGFPIAASIFVAVIALISNQWGIYLNKKYDVKFFINKKHIEDTENLILQWENVHEKLFELFQKFTNIRYISHSTLTDEMLNYQYSQIMQLSQEFAKFYFSNYSIFNNDITSLFNNLNASMSTRSFQGYWQELRSTNIALQTPDNITKLQNKFFKEYDDNYMNFLTVIMNNIQKLKAKKNTLLNDLEEIFKK